MPTKTWSSHSEAETEAIGEELAALLGPDGIVLIEGDLGGGKTVLVRGLARALGIDRREVQSPTYALIHEHEGSAGRLVHADLYRLEPEEVEGLGLDELFAGPGMKAVEWPDRLQPPPRGAKHIFIHHGDSPEERKIQLQGETTS